MSRTVFSTLASHIYELDNGWRLPDMEWLSSPLIVCTLPLLPCPQLDDLQLGCFTTAKYALYDGQSFPTIGTPRRATGSKEENILSSTCCAKSDLFYITERHLPWKEEEMER
jgi:hypothetical protein